MDNFLVKLLLVSFLMNLSGCFLWDGNDESDSTVKTFGGGDREVGSDIIPTSDGGFIVIGYTSSVDGDFEREKKEEEIYCFLKLIPEMK